MKILFLVGMMGAGKSSVARVIRNILDEDFELIDSDSQIEKNTDTSIHQIFEQKGEFFFRKLEEQFLNNFKTSNAILSTGGGMPFFNDNWQLLNKIGTTFFLSHSLEQLLENISKSKVPRPLFNENNFRQLYKDRLPLYQQSSFTINCENLHQTQIARKIIKLYKS